MKKLVATFTSLCMLCSMFSCGPSKAEQEAREKEVADSIANAMEQARQDSIEQARQDSAEKVNFTSKDLAFNELHGHVKTLTYDQYTTYEYSEDGTLLKVNGKDPFVESGVDDDTYCLYKRNKEGYIVSVQLFEGATDYTWENGRIKSMDSGSEGIEDKILLKYDENGRRTGFTDKSTDYADGSTQTIICKYTYVSFDELGNWTKRTCSSDGATETRKITYY